MAVPDELRKRYEAAGQGHVFKYLDAGKVPEEQKAAFLAQLTSLDLDFVTNSYRGAVEEVEQAKKAAAEGRAQSDLEPPSSFGCLEDTAPAQIAAWETEGLQAIGRGEVAACVLAGGQGTRLGFDGPKGCYDMKFESGKSLFQIYAERVRRVVALASQAGGTASRVPLLVMTSPLNHKETVAFFEQNGHFGLPADDVWFFQQGTLPCMTPEGKLILESAGVVATAPDGNGGFYPALQKSGCLARMQEQGIKYIHVFSVDNLLCRPADPRFAGYCIQQGADCGNKCVWKVSPEEKVGVIARRGGKSTVVEYSELDESKKQQRDASGRLVFGAGNICNHFFSVAFLSDKVLPAMANLFHLANKKIPCADAEGLTMKPEKENGIKLEAFIFDVFTLSSNMAILETLREEEFGPVKNAPGAATDSPETAKALLNALGRRWIKEAGGQLSGPEEALVEISPLLSYAGEGLEAKVKGQVIAAPSYLTP
mmetsp:Transcript_2585/g.5996  ORF Transcript_2585/g.5996 Transcript_2585/m.5996 type:complete len:482 (+) Transcript_2585:59-1504(+)